MDGTSTERGGSAMCRLSRCIGYITVALGVGILFATVFPPWVIVFLLSIVTICIGLCIIRK